MLKHDFASHIENLKCVTKPRSEALGRHLWTCTIDADSYWLKFHLPNVHAQSEQDFLHELQFYEDITYKKRIGFCHLKLLRAGLFLNKHNFKEKY